MQQESRKRGIKIARGGGKYIDKAVITLVATYGLSTAI